MSVLKEFRDFMSRGSVIDLAVGVIVGGAFGKIVTSLVTDVIMPPIGMLMGGVDFSAFKLVLKAADPVHKAAEVAINYGNFINTLIQFLVVAAAIFAVVRAINSLRRSATAPAAPTPTPTPTEALLAEIRDLLARDPRTAHETGPD